MLNNKIYFEETALIKDIKIYEKGSEFPTYFKFVLQNCEKEIVLLITITHQDETTEFKNKVIKKDRYDFDIETLDKLIKKFLYYFYK